MSSNNHSSIMEPAFVSVDLESSLGIIKDDVATEEPDRHSQSTMAVCQTTNSKAPVLVNNAFEETPIMMPTRTSDTYPFSNEQLQQELKKMQEDDESMDEDNVMMEETTEADTMPPPPTSSTTTTNTNGMSLDPIPVSEEPTANSMMMIMLQDNDEAKEVLVKKFGCANGTKQNENGYNIVPNDTYLNWVNDNIDLSETEVDEDDDTLLDIMEKEAKESGFQEIEIGDRQSFWSE